jgi:hypothetical protein
VNGIDLKMTTTETKDAIERIQRAGERVAEALSASLKARADMPLPPNITTASVAAMAVIDFPFKSWPTGRSAGQLQLAFNGQSVGSADLAAGLPDGRYRALITIERLGDLE